MNKAIVAVMLMAVAGPGYAGDFALDGIKAEDVRGAAVAEAELPAVPQRVYERKLEDIARCGVMDLKFNPQPRIKEAAAMLAPCMKDLSAQYGVPVKTKVSGKGIEITVGESENAYNLIKEAVDRRNGFLWNYPVRIKRAEPCVAPGPGASIEQIQAWVDCVPLPETPSQDSCVRPGPGASVEQLHAWIDCVPLPERPVADTCVIPGPGAPIELVLAWIDCEADQF